MSEPPDLSNVGLPIAALDKNAPITADGQGPHPYFQRFWQNLKIGFAQVGEAFVAMQVWVDAVSATYLLTVSAPGSIAKFRAFAGPELSEIRLQADQVILANEDGTLEQAPFYLDEDGIIHIVYAKIGLLEVDTVLTENILNGAVSGMLSDQNSTPMPVSGAGGSGGIHLTSYYNCTGGKMLVTASGDIGTSGPAAAGTVINLYCDGVLIKTGGIWNPGSWGSTGRDITIGHEPGAGTHTYDVEYVTPSGGGSSGPYTVNASELVMTEIKK